MDVMSAIQTRRSIRSYQDRPVEEEKLRLVLEAGRLAPSASNRQEWRFVVARDPDTRGKLALAVNNQDFVGEVAAVIAACALETKRHMACGEKPYPVDLAIAVDHMTLKATEEGLGTCWIGAFDQERTKNILGIPDEAVVVQLLPLGYPDAWPGPRPRKPLDEAVYWDRWGG